MTVSGAAREACCPTPRGQGRVMLKHLTMRLVCFLIVLLAVAGLTPPCDDEPRNSPSLSYVVTMRPGSSQS